MPDAVAKPNTIHQRTHRSAARPPHGASTVENRT